MPTGLMLPLCGNTLQSKIFRAQADLSLPLKKQIWKQVVSSKIRNQGRILECEELAAEPLLELANAVKSGDSGNLEGQAAAYYWKTVFPSIPDFVRSRDGEPPNTSSITATPFCGRSSRAPSFPRDCIRRSEFSIETNTTRIVWRTI